MSRGTSGTELESRVRGALRDYAATYAAPPVRDPEQWPLAAPAPPRRPRVRVAVAVVTVAFALVVAAWLLIRDPSTRVTTPPANPSAPTTVAPSEVGLPAPVNAGPEIELTVVPAHADELATPGQLEPGTRPLALRAGTTSAPAIISTQIDRQTALPTTCLWVRQGGIPPDGGGLSGECGGATLQAFYYPVPHSVTDVSVLYAWAAVPAGTAYVTFESTLLNGWERPVGTNAVFAVPGGPVDAVARAFGADGRLLGETQIPKSYNTAHYLPGQDPNADTTVPNCDRQDGPTDASFSIFDHATGVPFQMTEREYCKEIAAAQPYPDLLLQQAGLGAVVVGRNGRVAVDYVEVVNGVTDSSRVVPRAEVARRIAQLQQSSTSTTRS